MKCICISCFNYYATRMKPIMDFYSSQGYDVAYLIADYNHFDKKYEKHEGENWVSIHVSPYTKNLSFNRLYSHYEFGKKTVQYIKEAKPDVIYSMFPPNSLVKEIGKYKRANPSCKVIFDCYDMWPESFPKTKYASLLKIPFKLWADVRNRHINAADLVIAPSAYGKKNLEGIVKKPPMHVLYPALEKGVIPPYFSDMAQGLSFCYLGNINYITDTELCVALLGALAAKRKVTLHHIGGGQGQQELMQKLTDAGVQVVCHGLIFDMDEKNKIFSQCHLGLNIPRKEIDSSMALKSVEYMRAGLPFVNSGLGDNALMMEEYRLGVNCKDAETAETTAQIILSWSADDLKKMHENCVACYEKLFVNQDLGMLVRS